MNQRNVSHGGKSVRGCGLIVVWGVLLVGEALLERSHASEDSFDGLQDKSLAQFTEADVDVYVREYHEIEPDLQRRVRHYVDRSLGQQFELGAPSYALDRCDCVTFVERCYALALARDADSYRRLTSRLRHKDGVAGRPKARCALPWALFRRRSAAGIQRCAAGRDSALRSTAGGTQKGDITDYRLKNDGAAWPRVGLHPSRWRTSQEIGDVAFFRAGRV